MIVPIIDRGPYIRGRLIDLSEAAAQMLGMKWVGLAQVRIDVVPSCLKAKPITRVQTTDTDRSGATRMSSGFGVPHFF